MLAPASRPGSPNIFTSKNFGSEKSDRDSWRTAEIAIIIQVFGFQAVCRSQVFSGICFHLWSRVCAPGVVFQQVVVGKCWFLQVDMDTSHFFCSLWLHSYDHHPLKLNEKHMKERFPLQQYSELSAWKKGCRRRMITPDECHSGKAKAICKDK